MKRRDVPKGIGATALLPAALSHASTGKPANVVPIMSDDCCYEVFGLLRIETAMPSEEMKNAPAGMLRIPDARFRMGSEHHYIEESPEHDADVTGFWIDRFPVTNEDYRRFVDATDYVTLA